MLRVPLGQAKQMGKDERGTREGGFSTESQQPMSYIDTLAMSLRSDLHTSHSLCWGWCSHEPRAAYLWRSYLAEGSYGGFTASWSLRMEASIYFWAEGWNPMFAFMSCSAGSGWAGGYSSPRGSGFSTAGVLFLMFSNALTELWWHLVCHAEFLATCQENVRTLKCVLVLDNFQLDAWHCANRLFIQALKQQLDQEISQSHREAEML